MKIVIGGKELDVDLREIPVDEVLPDLDQPRRYEITTQYGKPADKPEDIEKSTRFTQLVRSILENNGISIPLIVEQQEDDVFLLLDGDRRLGACKYILNNDRILEEHPDAVSFLKSVPALVVHGPLSSEQRLRLLAHLHVHTVSWKPTGKEKVVKDLSKLLREDERVASIMGVTMGSIAKQREISELSERFTEKKRAAKSYARELSSIRRGLVDDEIRDVTVRKVNDGIIKSPLELRKLRRILPDPDAREEYLKDETSIEDAVRISRAKEIFREEGLGLPNLLGEFTLRLKSMTVDELMKFKGDPEAKKSIIECLKLLEDFKTYI